MKTKKHHTSALPDLKDEIVKALIEEFQDEEYREGYTEDFINTKIATQIKVLREQREWSQERLANESGMKQERVCVLEDVDYDAWTLKVLRRFAHAFGLVADFEFKEYGEFVKEFQQFGRERLEKRDFVDDPIFQHKTRSRFGNKGVIKHGEGTGTGLGLGICQPNLFGAEITDIATKFSGATKQSILSDSNTSDFLLEEEGGTNRRVVWQMKMRS